MNETRRRKIRRIIKRLPVANPAELTQIAEELDDLLIEEEEARDNTPEGLQDTDRFSVCEESCDYLAEAVDTLDADDPSTVQDVIDILNQIDGV